MKVVAHFFNKGLKITIKLVTYPYTFGQSKLNNNNNG